MLLSAVNPSIPMSNDRTKLIVSEAPLLVIVLGSKLGIHQKNSELIDPSFKSGMLEDLYLKLAS